MDRKMTLWALNMLTILAAIVAFCVATANIFTSSKSDVQLLLWIIPLGLSIMGGGIAGALASKWSDTIISIVLVAGAWLAVILL
jgi:hypothetical protein